MKGGEKCHAEKVDFETHTNSDKRSKKTEVKKERNRPMANGVDHYDENENGGDVEASSLPSCVSWQQIGLPSHLL